METTREHLVSFGSRFVPRGVRCDDSAAAFIEGEPMRVSCGGPGRHVLAIDYAAR